jgi:pimeloyl-ACP methyl ester carboxylesterase
MDPVLLLVHGIGSTRAFWDPVLPLLPEYTCVAVDVPGFGAAAALGERMTVPGLAVALDDDRLGPVVIVGHSLGGMIAQELALRAPDRVRGLVLCNTIPGVTQGAREFNPVLAGLAETAGPTAVAEALLPAMLGLRPLENTERARERFLADMRASDPASLAAAFRAVVTFDARNRLPSLRDAGMPALVIAGQHEGNGDDQQELADLLGARCEFLPGTSHLAPVEAPTAFAAEVVPFLARVRDDDRGGGWR